MTVMPNFKCQMKERSQGTQALPDLAGMGASVFSMVTWLEAEGRWPLCHHNTKELAM
jgi:hypothetical protein